MIDTSKRPSWDEYFMSMADYASTRTTCLRRAVGAVIVKDHRVLATGYNGVPTGIRHCAEVGCLRQQLGVPSGQRHEICRGLHAEQNAIIQAARYGVDISGASIYVNTQPCVVCAKMLINAGITEIVYKNPYPDELSMQMLKESGIRLRVYDPATKTAHPLEDDQAESSSLVRAAQQPGGMAAADPTASAQTQAGTAVASAGANAAGDARAAAAETPAHERFHTPGVGE